MSTTYLLLERLVKLGKMEVVKEKISTIFLAGQISEEEYKGICELMGE